MIGETISHYKILDKLGGGGMGVVYKARDIKLKRLVALKFLPPELTCDPQAKQRFVIEAQAASSLDHPNICTIHEIDETDSGSLFICMSYYRGETLKKRIESGRMTLAESIDISIQIAEGLAEAHANGIVHRDIKPANVIINPGGRDIVKIVDFGLAKLAGQSITKSTPTMGTVTYMSPESIRALPVDHRTDLWSLGVVLFEMLTRHLPFSGEYPEPLMYSIVNEAPKSLDEYLSDVPEDLQRLLDKALRKEPEERYQDAASFLTDLRQVKKDALAVVPDKTLRRKASQKKVRFPGMRYYAALVLVVILVGLGFYWQRERSISPEGPFTAEEWHLIQQAKEKKIVIAIAPFWGTDEEASQEGRVMQALIARKLFDELGQEPRVNILTPDIDALPRTHEEAKSLGIELKATLVIWGEVFILRGEVEIQPYLTTIEQPVEGWGLSVSAASTALKADISEPDQLSFRRSKADEVGNLALLISGRYYSKIGNDEKALAILHRILPQNSLSLASIGRLYAFRNEAEKADSIYRESLALDPNNARTYLCLASLYFTNYQPKVALELAQKALKLDPNLPDTYKTLGQIYAFLGEKEKALTVFEQGLSLDHQNADLHFSLGWEYSSQFKLDQAVEECKKALELNPLHEWAYIALGRAYRGLEKYEEAEQALKKAITLHPLNELPYRVLGNTYRAQGKDALALKHFLKARDVDPDNHFVYYNLGHFYWKKKRYDEAITTWQKARELAPNAAYYRYFLAVTYLVQGHYQKVDEVYQEALNDGYDPESSQMAPFYSYFGYIQDIQGNKEEAIKFYQKRLEKGRPLLIAVLNFCALNDLKRHKEAREFLSNFIQEENDPGSWEVSWEVTKARFLLGELSESDFLEETELPVSVLKKDRQCEAYFYMGKARLLKVSPEDRITVADSSRAREFFRECLELEKDRFLNFDIRLWANVELRRLEGASPL